MTPLREGYDLTQDEPIEGTLGGGDHADVALLVVWWANRNELEGKGQWV